MRILKHCDCELCEEDKDMEKIPNDIRYDYDFDKYKNDDSFSELDD